MTFQVIASGSTGNALIVTAGQTRLLIDCGLSRRELFKRLHRNGYKAEELTAILLTHEHGDHAGHSKDVSHVCGICEYGDGIADPFVIGDIAVLPFAVPHDADWANGYLLEHDSQRIAIATDLGHIPPDVAGVLRLAHLLYIESNHDLDMLKAGPYEHLLRSRIVGDLGHLSNEQTAAFLREQLGPETRHVVLGHLSTVANTPELCEAIARQALADRGYGGTLAVVPAGEVGERITL